MTPFELAQFRAKVAARDRWARPVLLEPVDTMRRRHGRLALVALVVAAAIALYWGLS